MILKKISFSKLSLPSIILNVLFIAFVAFRLITAWMFRNECDGDLAIVQLMVRDMVDYGHVPSFFYGQAYMGSLEPIFNAFLYLCCGRTNFGLELGTALFAILMFFVAVRISRRIGGEWSAIVTAAFLMIGPPGFVHYMVSPRGGYGVLLFTTVAVIDSGMLLISRWRSSGKLSVANVLALGMIIGIGFWCNQLVAPAVAAVAVGVIFFAPRLLLRPLLWFCGVVSFLVGSLPFWLWNAKNDWESFEMSHSLVLDVVVVARNLALLVCERWSQFAGVDASRSELWLKIVILCVSAVPIAAAAFALRFCRDAYAGERDGNRFTMRQTHISVLFLYLLFFVTCFVCSHFATFSTPRYLLPLMPIMAILAGVGATVPRCVSFRYAAIIAVIIIVCWDAKRFSRFSEMAARHDGYAARNTDVYRFIEEKRIDAAYCSFVLNSMNLAGNSGIVFSDYLRERVPDFRRKLEMADSPAVIENFGGIATWALASGGTAENVKVRGCRVSTSIIPPSMDCSEISPDEIASITNAFGIEVSRELSDRSRFVPVYMNPDGDSLAIVLKQPHEICGIRILASNCPLFKKIKFSGRESGSAEFVRIAHDLPDVSANWSGPRFYPERSCILRETYFQPQNLLEIKIEFEFAEGEVNGTLYEVQLLTKSSQTIASLKTVEDWRGAAKKLVAQLDGLGITKLYAQRWIANFVDSETSGAILTNFGDDAHPKLTGSAQPPSGIVELVLNDRTGVLLPESGCPAMRDICRMRHLHMREIDAGALGTIFIPESAPANSFGLNVTTGIMFCGTTVMLTSSDVWMTQVLNALPAAGSRESLAALHASNPDSLPLLLRLVKDTDFLAERFEIDEKIKLLSCPSFGSVVNFNNGLSWLGGRVLSQCLTDSGDTMIVIRYYWSLDPAFGGIAKDLRVFTHLFSPAGERICADFELAAKENWRRDESGKYVWHCDMRIKIPARCQQGPFEMRIGLYNKNFSSHRVGLKTSLPHWRNAAKIKAAFVIEPRK